MKTQDVMFYITWKNTLNTVILYVKLIMKVYMKLEKK